MSFLRYFTLTGIPVLADVSEMSQSNPWYQRIWRTDGKNIYPIVCQTILNNNSLDEDGGGGGVVFRKKRGKGFANLDGRTPFNAIVPIFTPELAAVLKPLILTKVFTSLCSFCVLRNPFLVDEDAHFAALVRLWVELALSYTQ